MKGLSLQVMILSVAMVAGAAQLTAQCSGPMSVAVQGSGSGLPLTASETHINAQCPGENGSVTITATGGTQPFVMGVGTFSQPVGTQIYTVTDFVGCMSSVSVTITSELQDVSPPTVVCKPFTANLNAAGQASIVPANVYQSGADHCGVVNLLAVAPSTFNCSNIGENLVTLRVNDGNGNSASCVALVTVRDAIPPVAICKSITADLGSNGTVIVPASAINNGSSDNCSFSLLLTPNTFNCSQIGMNTVVLRVTDAGGNTATCSAKVTVRDVSAPIAKCKNPTIFLNDAGQATLSVAQVDNGSTDNCGTGSSSISKTSFNCSEISGTNPVTLSLTDVNGNSSSCLSYVTVKDAIAPTAVCENITVQLNAYGRVTVYGEDLAVESYDNCSVWSYSPLAKVYTTANLGNNNLINTVKDWSNNASTCVSVVTVRPFIGFDGLDGLDGNRSDSETVDLEIRLFPTPTAGDANLAFALPAEQAFTLILYDMSGRMVLHQKGIGLEGYNIFPIRLEGFAPGVYIVDFQTEGLKGKKRLVVQR